MVDVFISYARQEIDRARPINAALVGFGFSTFFDVDRLDGSKEFPEEIDTELRAARFVIGVWSPYALTRSWVKKEARIAIHLKKFFSVSIEPFALEDHSTEFVGRHLTDLNDFYGDVAHAGFLELMNALTRELKLPSFQALIRIASAARFPAVPISTTSKTQIDVHAGRRSAAKAGANQGDAAPTDRPVALAARRATNAGSASSLETPTPGAVFRIEVPNLANWPRPEMVVIPPGRFNMGSPDGEERWQGYDGREQPVHKVAIDYPFALGKYPVTFEAWDAARAAGAALEPLDDATWRRLKRPVINVSWEDAQAYLAWLNGRLGLSERADAYRLPSEAEWEYACRAGTTTPFSFGETISPDQANYDGNYVYGAGKKGVYREKTMPVGSFPANGFGLHEMHGNVWEWCADAWNENHAGAPDDGSAWLTGDVSARVVRGGSWVNYPRDLRSAFRSFGAATVRYGRIGFRVARTLSPSGS